MFGLVFMCGGLEFLYYAVGERDENGFSIGIVMLVAMSLAAVSLGIRVFRNGFPRRAKPTSK
jgi:hypothetical protein